MSEATTRVFLVTGAAGAIGHAIAQRLAANSTHAVVLVTRDVRRGEAVTRQIRTQSGNAAVHHERCDLSRRVEIEALATRWSGPLHVLVNNAATAPRAREETEEGIERLFATNVLGYFWMTRAFTPVLARSAPARVVNVASYWAGDLALDDLEFTRRPYDNDTAYRQSKQANRMLTVAFAERLSPLGVTVNACHPGDVASKLSRDLGFGGHESADEGADTPVWLAVDELGGRESGRYFAHRRAAACSYGRDRAAVERLYARCEEY